VCVCVCACICVCLCVCVRVWQCACVCAVYVCVYAHPSNSLYFTTRKCSQDTHATFHIINLDTINTTSHQNFTIFISHFSFTNSMSHPKITNTISKYHDLKTNLSTFARERHILATGYMTPTPTPTPTPTSQTHMRTHFHTCVHTGNSRKHAICKCTRAPTFTNMHAHATAGNQPTLGVRIREGDVRQESQFRGRSSILAPYILIAFLIHLLIPHPPACPEFCQCVCVYVCVGE